MRIQRSIQAPIRTGLSTADLWQSSDLGLIACWERGRELAVEQPELARQAKDGVLMTLPWKGGVDRKLKGNAPKVGTYRYLAMWLGLRNEDLDIDTSKEVIFTCTRFGQDVLFTDDPDKYAADAE